ncbi:integrase_H2C2 domain-containing protein [Trichonephila clavipes]|nr:integrase_H2C2 domain-containing protein [Trichonephila clavipes]
MIWINPDQRKLQRILWRENMDEPIKTFELSTVTYGTTSAPFLATRTLKQLALDESGNFPLGSSVVMSDMYIDDVLTGAETLLEAKELKNQLINIFAKGGMVLHKWCGNNTELIEVSENYDFSDSSEIKVLGVYWNPKHDCFSLRVKIDLHELNTKRDVLSTIARIYDPLGLLGPVVAKAKIFLQKLWMLKIDWTDLLPDTINREWRQFVESLQVVNDININRCIVVEQSEVIEMHGFSDASQSAYGAVVYCKSITSDGKMLVHLIASKSRVAPTKQTTIPRLELCAAMLLAKLVHRVKQALKLNVTNTFLWSDSMIVLSWLRKESYQLKTFVANRIATIQETTSSEQWRYVATEDNPADFVSRGMDSLKLKTCELWWNGPKFLMSNQYPQRQIPVALKFSVPIAGTSQPVNVQNKFSSLTEKEAETNPTTSDQTAAPISARPRVPPIMFKHKKANYRSIIKNLNKDFPDCEVKLAGKYFKILCKTSDEHRVVTDHLKVIKEEFYVIDPPDSRPLKVVIKGLPISTEINEIQDDLTLQGFSVEKVAQLTRSKTKAPPPFSWSSWKRNLTPQTFLNLKSAATSRCRSTLSTDDRGFHSVTTVTCLTTRRKTASCAPDV